MKERVVIIGAGSAMFTRGLIADLIQRGWQCDLALVDTNPEALAAAEGLAKKMIAARRAPISLSGSTDRRAVLRGATVVICTIGVGGRQAWLADVTIPRKYGIYQPVGDTAMPGGTSRALRMIPAMAAIARDVLDLCPEALFFNYGNPMSCVCRGVRRATGADVIGLCHGVNMVGQYLAEALGVEVSRLRHNAVGINHLTWFTQVWIDGQDAMPQLLSLARQRCCTAKDKPVAQLVDPFCWELTSLVGAFPAVLDRHVVEFFPQFFRDGQYYGKTLGVDVYSVEETINRGDHIYQEMQQAAASTKPLPEDYFDRTGGEHEQVVEIIEHIRAGRPAVYSANVPNRGIVSNLPQDAVIECPALTTADGLRPLAQPPLAAALAGTLATRFQWVETTVEAALEGSRHKFITALVLDGSVTSLEQAAALADELLAEQAQHLPQFAGKE